ncbi:MAG: hypothetical protein IJQ77_03800 [Synergistaceae bacterium]|nr:hypothetical protein [Synergistaceae bacterium]MBQ6110757.1 hypothetical protein [Synergistaceae bacterium]MBR0250183.1 hypothetical protein [Synergistaceae bacterium]
MTFNPEEIFENLISLRKKLEAKLPDDDLDVFLDTEEDVFPGCFLIYDPDQTKKTRKYHFIECSEIKQMHKEGCLRPYRITNNISGLFRMYDGSIERLPVCEKCIDECKYKYTTEIFDLREFFRKHNYESQIRDKDILAEIWMGAVEGIFRNDEYPEFWHKLISPVHKHISGLCEMCGTDENLVTHHINMYKPDTTNENLIVLCNSCHARIHAILQHIISGDNLKTESKNIIRKYRTLIESRII